MKWNMRVVKEGEFKKYSLEAFAFKFFENSWQFVNLVYEKPTLMDKYVTLKKYHLKIKQPLRKIELWFTKLNF